MTVSCPLCVGSGPGPGPDQAGTTFGPSGLCWEQGDLGRNLAEVSPPLLLPEPHMKLSQTAGPTRPCHICPQGQGEPRALGGGATVPVVAVVSDLLGGTS